MGELSKALSASRKKSKKSIPLKLVEPSSGRIVELEITEPDENLAKMYLSQLSSFAEYLNSNLKITGNTIQLEFFDNDMAEIMREKCKK